VNDQHVTLKGVVRSAVERRRADILARALGAAGVDNQLRIADDQSGDKRRRVA
jgi:osmotically-inducible protein OsmY